MTEQENNMPLEETTPDQPAEEQVAEESAPAAEEPVAEESAPAVEEQAAEESAPVAEGQTVEETLKSWWDEVEVAGHDAVEYIRGLVEEGNIRHIRLVNEKDETLLDIPLAAGVVVGAGAAVIAPFLLAVGVAAALLAKIRIRIERVDANETPVAEESPAESSATEENTDTQA
ncbi:MAG: DUF4342 domain-containing protein [Phototrophicaceae bacterium]